MNYFKTIVKGVYQKVLQDDYLQQITEQQLYYILSISNRKRALSTSNDPRKLSAFDINQELFDKVDMLGNVSPEREFRILGADPKFEAVLGRCRDLEEDLREVTELMKGSFNRYEGRVNEAIAEVDCGRDLYQARKHAMELRTKIQKLQQASHKSKRITELNIRAKNLKLVLKSMGQIPKIKQMTLAQLKSLNIEAMRSRPIIGKLKCLQKLEQFIGRAVATQLTQVLHILEQCVINKFEQNLYENALKDFIIAQHQNIKYQKLLIKLVQKQIHKIDSELGSNLHQICQFYIRLMTNLHGVFGWHRNNEALPQWQNLSKGHYGICIEINISNITKCITSTMDENLKDVVLQKYYHQEEVSESLQAVYLVMRISQIACCFSGMHFVRTLAQTTEYLYKKLLKNRQKCLHELDETLKNEQRNSWNRLPVVNDYSHEGVDRSLYQIFRHRTSAEYLQVLRVLARGSEVLEALVVEGRDRERAFGRQKVEARRGKDQRGDYEEEETWEIEAVSFPAPQKYQKNKSMLRRRQSNPNQQTIICQYSLNILKYLQTYTRNAFYYPIEPVLSLSLNTACFILQQYLYQIFTGFVSNSVRNMFMERMQSLATLEQKYHKKRFHYQYPMLAEFLHTFKKANNITSRENNQGQSRASQGNSPYAEKLNSSKSLGSSTDLGPGEGMIVRSRVVALESFSFLLGYFANMIKLAGFVPEDNEDEISPISPITYAKKNEQNSQPLIRIDRPEAPACFAELNPHISTALAQKMRLYQQLYSQLSELIYTDCIPRLYNLKNTSNLIQAIRWSEEDDTREYQHLFFQSSREFYHKMLSTNRGEVPIQTSDRLFGVFWKTQLTTIIKTFLSKHRSSKQSLHSHPKHKLEHFIDAIYERVCTLVSEQQHLRVPYEKIKSIFPVLMEGNWETVLEMVRGSFGRFEFVWVVQLGLALGSQSCCYLGAAELEERRRGVEDWVLSNLIRGPD